MLAFINWEGRNYKPSDWEADKLLTMEHLGNPRPIHVLLYDVGLLVSDAPITKDSKITAYVRRGRLTVAEPGFADEAFERLELIGYTYDPDPNSYTDFDEMENRNQNWFHWFDVR